MAGIFRFFLDLKLGKDLIDAAQFDGLERLYQLLRALRPMGELWQEFALSSSDRLQLRF